MSTLFAVYNIQFTIMCVAKKTKNHTKVQNYICLSFPGYFWLIFNPVCAINIKKLTALGHLEVILKVYGGVVVVVLFVD